MKKKWIAGLLALCMCLSTVGFVGCKEDDGTGENGGNTEQGGNDTTAPEQDGDNTTDESDNQDSDNNGDGEQDTNTNSPEQDENNSDDNQQDNENNQQGDDTTPPDTPTPEPEITYVTTEEIFDNVFSSFNTDDIIKEILSKISFTRSPNYINIQLFAFDYNCYNDGHLTFYVERKSNSSGQSYIHAYILSGDTTAYKTLFDALQDITLIKSTFVSKYGEQLEENSASHLSAQQEVQALYDTLNKQIAEISATTKENIGFNSFFAPDILTEEEMTELGIDDMNAFSYALLENKRGDGYDLVTGFTKDDVIETYVDKASSPNIYGRTAFNIVTFAKNGIYKTLMGTAVAHSSEAFKKVLNDSSDNLMNTHKALVEFSENVILYDNGSRIN